MKDEAVRLRYVDKLRLAAQIWVWSTQVALALRRAELPEYVGRVGAITGPPTRRPLDPRRLSGAVDRTLTLGRLGPRCIVRALVLYRLLKTQGDKPELVIGLSENPKDHLAHAWIELDRVDIGPRPGRHGHQELARFS